MFHVEKEWEGDEKTAVECGTERSKTNSRRAHTSTLSRSIIVAFKRRAVYVWVLRTLS